MKASQSMRPLLAPLISQPLPKPPLPLFSLHRLQILQEDVEAQDPTQHRRLVRMAKKQTSSALHLLEEHLYSHQKITFFLEGDENIFANRKFVMK